MAAGEYKVTWESSAGYRTAAGVEMVAGGRFDEIAPLIACDGE